MSMLDQKASLGNIPCRYRDNLDNTVTDFRTGLMWAKLGRQDGVASADLLDVDNRYDWKTCLEVAATLNGTGPWPPTTLTPIPVSGGHSDWRIPNVLELDTIKDRSDPARGVPGHMPCIDPIFGPTLPRGYITSTLHRPTHVWLIQFGDPTLIELTERNQFFSVRPVRTAF